MVLHYLKNTRQAKLVYKKSEHNEFKIKIMSDASYGAFPVHCSFIYLNDCLIHVNVARNKATSLSDTDQVTSSMHSELSGIFDGTKLGVHVYNILIPYSEVDTPIVHLNDSKSAIFNADGFVNNKKTLHLAVKYRYVTELIHKKFMMLNYESGKLLHPDIDTKALPAGPLSCQLPSLSSSMLMSFRL